MKNFFNWLGRHIVEVIVGFSVVYISAAFLSPVFFAIGWDEPAKALQFIDKHTCHQRVERSLFLFGEDKFAAVYTIEDLEKIGYIPDLSDYKTERDYLFESYGYPYWGNEKIGYKVAICIRDIGLYSSYAIFGVWIVLYFRKTKKIPKFPVWMFVALMVPMAFDGIFQAFVGLGYFPSIPYSYVTNIDKRWLTGALFGIGFGMFVYPRLIDSVGEVYKDQDPNANDQVTK